MNKKKNRTNKNRTKRRLQKMKNNTKKKQIRKYRKKKGGMSPNPDTKTFEYAGGTYTGPYRPTYRRNTSNMTKPPIIVLVPHGYGSWINKDGEKYVGHFRNGMRLSKM